MQNTLHSQQIQLPQTKLFKGLICTVNENGIYIFAEKKHRPPNGIKAVQHYAAVLARLIDHQAQA